MRRAISHAVTALEIDAVHQGNRGVLHLGDASARASGSLFSVGLVAAALLEIEPLRVERLETRERRLEGLALLGLRAPRLLSGARRLLDAIFLFRDHRAHDPDGERRSERKPAYQLLAFLDPLRDLDLALARKQTYRAHLSQIHANGIVAATGRRGLARLLLLDLSAALGLRALLCLVHDLDVDSENMIITSSKLSDEIRCIGRVLLTSSTVMYPRFFPMSIRAWTSLRSLLSFNIIRASFLAVLGLEDVQGRVLRRRVRERNLSLRA